jgi:hypothetical protein
MGYTPGGTDAQQQSGGQDGKTTLVTSVIEQNNAKQAPAPALGQASTPAPVSVIHAVAQRAETDPKLKSVVKVVAAGQASKDQLELFQTNLNDSASQNHTTGQKRGAAANEKVRSKKRKSSNDPQLSTTGGETAEQEPRKV